MKEPAKAVKAVRTVLVIGAKSARDRRVCRMAVSVLW